MALQLSSMGPLKHLKFPDLMGDFIFLFDAGLLLLLLLALVIAVVARLCCCSGSDREEYSNVGVDTRDIRIH